MSYTHFLKCMNSWNAFHKQGHSPLAETVTVPALSQEMDNYLTLSMLSLIDDTYTSHIRSKESHFCLPFWVMSGKWNAQISWGSDFIGWLPKGIIPKLTFHAPDLKPTGEERDKAVAHRVLTTKDAHLLQVDGGTLDSGCHGSTYRSNVHQMPSTYVIPWEPAQVLVKIVTKCGMQLFVLCHGVN